MPHFVKVAIMLVPKYFFSLL